MTWAYKTTGRSSPRLCFKRQSFHLIEKFEWVHVSGPTQHFMGIVKSQPLLLQMMADMAISWCADLNSQNVANFLWTYAVIGQTDQSLFLSFAPAVKSTMGEWNSQELAKGL